MEVTQKLLRKTKALSSIFIRYILNFLESTRKYSFNLLNNGNIISKEFFKKILSIEEQLKVYSPFTLICFGLFIALFYYLNKVLYKKTKKIFRFLKNLKANLILFYIMLPGQKEKLDKAQQDSRKAFDKAFRKDKYKPIEFRDNKQDYTKILAKMEQYIGFDTKASKCGKLTGSVYCDDDQIKYIASEAAKMFFYSNLLHSDIYTYGRFLESEVIKFGLDLFNGKEGSCGITTSGGTSSILHAIYAYRQRGKVMGIKKPELIIPESAHAAFFKACEMFKIKCIKIPLNEEYQVNLTKLKNHINKNTIAIVGSFPNFPHSLHDDIEGLSKIAIKYNIPLHVDCCLGGFLVSFYEKAGISIPLFDFRLPGVTSISADLHKYGLCPKGISLLLFSKNEFRRYIYFIYPHFMGGIYFTTSFEGSRTAGLIASAYAILTSLGKDHYTKMAIDIHNAVFKLKEFIEKDCELLQVIGDPCICGVSFTGSNIQYIYDLLSKRGYHLNYLNNPVGIGYIFTSANVKNIDQLINDLKEVHEEVKKGNLPKLGDSAKLYGMAIELPESVAKYNLAIYGDSVLD